MVFFALAFAFTWSLLPLASATIVASLAALCGPALAALLTAALVGRPELAALRDRLARWRVPPAWLAVALLLPLPVTALRSVLERLAGVAGPVRLQEVTPLGLVVFVLVAGEEIGWRGFALPRLLARFGPWTASVVLGAMWALWHLPLFFMAGMPQRGTPFASYVPYLIALSVLLTALARHTSGSVLVATLFHGAVNTLGLVVAGASAAQRGWANAVSYGLAALLIGVALLRRPVAGGNEWVRGER